MLAKRRATTSVAAFVLFAFSASTAFAASEQEITDAITALIKTSPDIASVELGTPEADGDSLVYSDVKVTGTAPDSITTIGTLTVTGGDLGSDGGLIASTFSAENIEVKEGANVATVGSIEINGLELPAATSTAPKGKFDDATVTEVVVNEGGKEMVKVAEVTFEASNYVDSVPRNVAFSATDIAVSVDTLIENDPSATQLKDLGYTDLVLGLSASGGWDEASGDVVVEDLSVGGAEMGALSISASLGGLTPDVAAQLAGPTPPPDAIAKLTISEIVVSYTDESLVGRLIEAQAKQMGVDPAAFVEQITGAMPLMLTAIQNPAFADKVAAATTTFLKEPRNIIVTAAPAAPVPVMELMAVAETEPGKIADMLNVDIQANVEESGE